MAENSTIAIVGAAVIGSLATLGTQYFSNSIKDREISLQYLNIAISILREDPEKTNIGAVRGWAVDLINETAPVSINDDVRSELLKNRLDSVAFYNYIKAMNDPKHAPTKDGLAQLGFGGLLLELPFILSEPDDKIEQGK